MRVLIVQPSMNIYGGPELVIVKLAEYLANTGIEHALLTTNILPEIEKDLSCTPIFKSPYKHSKNWEFDVLKDMWLLNNGVRQRAKKYDIINIHNFPAEFSVFPISKPVVWVCHESPDVYLSKLSREHARPTVLAQKVFYAADRQIVKRYVKRAVVPDKYNAGRFQSIYSMTPHVIPYGIDYDFFAAAPDDFYVKRNGDFIVLHVGNLSEFKNQKESIRCVKLLKKDIPGIRLVIAGFGDGAYINELKSIVQEEGLLEHVLITGHVNRDRLKVFYHRADVLLHPIRQQGGWMTPFEALAAGTPVIVSKDMTASDIIVNEGIGVVTDDYTAALSEVYQNLRKHREVATSGRLFIRNHLRWDNFSAGMVKVFQEALHTP
ncbi:glycosyltransferase family 4 protein [Candidatus Magnetominusculus xianensis]|uniref:GDP-mannose-dependent alpha-(1-6)-phosphatidylinositol monomannoside mannosyltransferase n=1 Tax=Candidatus Magnetominusculus xianensis TaxID=1748249 RepID=A0ABR5SGC8_9BACT|nr:glycosyltransferase family 4 protein [Candidatus Magnetominusculus xianensis]KWT89409.1 GDP-mannose-dependent alpha-(1-6)-phosphatidylinositol monomannoside mannosyltransferase [Candidatus Magnetominusculus xianensis]MBF0405498.1 glycosyltransferase family 4 protein [Nitrospirota bacterium]